MRFKNIKEIWIKKKKEFFNAVLENIITDSLSLIQFVGKAYFDLESVLLLKLIYYHLGQRSSKANDQIQ